MEDRTNIAECSCNFGDGTDQMVQSLMFMMMIMVMILIDCERKFKNNMAAVRLCAKLLFQISHKVHHKKAN